MAGMAIVVATATAVPAASGAAAAVAVSLGPSSVPVPHVQGPIRGPGAPSVLSTTFSLRSVGYRQAEYFISGTATSYRLRGRAPRDGRWSVTPGSRASYKTRLLVYRPVDPRRFDGTVVVEWLNVSAGSDTAADWINEHTQLIRQGMVWVGVSAQAIGVNGGVGVLGAAGKGLRNSDPGRYGSLHHPGDALSYDIFSQAGQAIRHSGTVSPLGGLHPKAVIAEGESQSAFFLTTYIDAIAPHAKVYDGYFVHSRWGGGTTMTGSLALGVVEPFRTDLHVPVMAFETETDLLEGYVNDRQPDSRWFRDWEVAGTSHADAYTTGIGLSDNGTTNAAEAVAAARAPLAALGCTVPPNSGPQHWVLDDAISVFNRWVRTGHAPPRAPRLKVSSGPHPAIERDALGNALGGIRTPAVDVPVDTLSGAPPPGTPLGCGLFGSTAPLAQSTLASLYPTHADYVAKFDADAVRAERAGFLLRPDVVQLEEAAAASSVP
jgi:hypothetical protein